MTHKQSLLRLALVFSLGTLALPQAHAQTSDVSMDPSDTPYPVVITPTRLRQSLADAPASVTVITSDMLRQYGITRIEDAFRLVPGMAVLQTGGSNYKINYHGTSTIVPRRLNVLIDGVSAYMAAFSRVEWSWLPVALEDVDRIEVIRGPDSSAYGPNSMMAVVNILTKHPKDVEPAMAAVTMGSSHIIDSTVRLATTIGSTSMRLTANTRDDDGMKNDAARSSLDEMTRASGLTFGDSTSVTRVNFNAHRDLTGGAALDVMASHVKAKLSATQSDFNQITEANPDKTQSQVSTRFTKPLSADHELQVNASVTQAQLHQHWTACWPTVAFSPTIAAFLQTNPAFVKLAVGVALDTMRGAPIDSEVTNNLLGMLAALPAQEQLMLLGLFSRAQALSPDCGEMNNDISESRSQIEIQDTYVVSKALRFVGGLGFRHQRATSQTMLSGSVQNDVKWVFGHAEYRPTDWLSTNVGGYGEHNSLGGRTFSPRVAFNTHLTDNHSVRAVFSKGTRSPDLFEEKANWRHTYTNLAIPINGATTASLPLQSIAPGGLSSEEIWSRELGYLLTLRSAGLTFDAKLFDDRLKNLISKPLSVYDFAPDNQGRVRLTGSEFQAQWDISRAWSTWLTYSHLLNHQANAAAETAQYSKNSGALGVSVALTDAWRASIAHYAASGNGPYELGYGRTDLTLAHHFALADHPTSLSLTVGYLQTPATKTYVGLGGTNDYVSAYYDSRFRVFGQARIAF